jgi:glyoxylase-like metal-dependent hydrolase (beta-lactamase superfamily II)
MLYKKIANDVFHIALMPRNSINAYIVDGFLIDSGIKSSFNKLSKAVSELSVHTHVLTHAHADHQGSSAKICKLYNLPLWCHKNEVMRAETGLVTNEYPSPNNLIAKFQQHFWAGDGYAVTKVLKENDNIGNFDVIETPGHSSGHISFFRAIDGVLILGDVATNMNLVSTIPGLKLPPSIFTTDLTENIKSLKKLAALNPKIICFGHGPVLKNNNRQFENFVNGTAMRF